MARKHMYNEVALAETKREQRTLQKRTLGGNQSDSKELTLANKVHFSNKVRLLVDHITTRQSF